MATITKRYCEGRRSPFQLAWIESGKRFSRFFSTEEDREAFIKASGYLDKMSFESLMTLDTSTIGDISRIESERGEITFREIWAFWKLHHKTRRVVNLWDACDAYIRDIKQKGKCDKEHIRHICRVLEVLVDEFGERLVGDIRRDELEKWLNDLGYSPVTKKNYRSAIRTAWGWFERQELVDKNVAKMLDCPVIELGEIGVLKVEEVEQLLRANEKVDPEVCGLLALGLFAGMRTSAISRVVYNEITMRQGILTPAEKTKKGRRNYIENLPDNLWAWLERTPQTAFGWKERKWKKRKELAFRRAGLLVNAEDVKKLTAKGIKAKIKLPPHNALRHSFASYHVAWKRDFQDTALIMSHRGTDILFKHYRGIATKEDAERYFAIYPDGWKTP